MSDDHKSQDEGRSEGRREGRAGGVGRDGSQKTRTPHRDVGKKQSMRLASKRILFVEMVRLWLSVPPLPKESIESKRKQSQFECDDETHCLKPIDLSHAHISNRAEGLCRVAKSLSSQPPAPTAECQAPRTLEQWLARVRHLCRRAKVESALCGLESGAQK